ncbi:hypothetical protein Emag_007504 [Eimeria magna]
MQSPPRTRSGEERENVVEVQPPHSVAAQQTVQHPSPAAAAPAATPSSPVARKRQRTEPAEPRIMKFVVGKLRPLDLKDMKNAKKRLAKSQAQEALQHKEIIYLHRPLKAHKGGRKEVLKVAKGFLSLPVGRGWTQPPESLVAKRKGQAEDSPAVEEIWDEWSSPFAKLERQRDDIYVAEFPEATAAPRWGTHSWTSFLTAFSRHSLSDPRPGNKKSGAGRRSPNMSLRSSQTRTRRPPAAGSQRNWRARRNRLRCPRLLPQKRIGRHRSLLRLHQQGSGPCDPADKELQWVDNISRTVAPLRPVLTSLPQGQSSLTGLADLMCQEQLGGRAVTDDQRGATSRFLGPGQSSAPRVPQRRILYGAGRAGIGGGYLRPRLVATPEAQHAPGAIARPAGPDSLSAPPGTPDVTTPPPPLPALRTEESGLPEPSVAVRDPPQQLGMDGLLNGPAGGSPADDVSSAADEKGEGSSAELSGVEQPAPKRAPTPGRRVYEWDRRSCLRAEHECPVGPESTSKSVVWFCPT